MKRQPIQSVGPDSSGVMRFRENAIVSRLLEEGPFTLNDIATWDVPSTDREQFAQLIGYSLSGFGGLSYASNEVYDAASRMAGGADPQEARIKALEEILEEIRTGLRIAASSAFPIHPDDLEAP